MRPVFYDFSNDSVCWDIENEYMFGPDVLVIPVTEQGCRRMRIYLPDGAVWTNAWTKEKFVGGQWIYVDTPIEQIPLFTKNGYQLPL